MSSTTASPSTLAALLANKRNAANRPNRPSIYTSESAAYRLAPPAPFTGPEPEIDETFVNETEFPEEYGDIAAMAAYGGPWTEWTLDDLGIDPTPRLRRTVYIDDVDPTEALDQVETFVGMRIFTP